MQKLLYLKISRFIVLAAGLTFQLSAETIVLKNGELISGKVTNQDKNNITIKLDNGKTRIFHKSQVAKVTYKSAEAVKNEKKAEEVKTAVNKLPAVQESMSPEEREKQEEAERKKLLQEREAQKKAEEELEAKEDAAKVTAPSLPNYLPFQAKSRLDGEQILWDQMHGDWLRKENDGTSSGQITLYGAIWRSTLLPGWGQYKQGRKKISYLWLGGFVALTGAMGSFSSAYKKADRDYQNQINPSLMYPLLLTNAGMITPGDKASLDLYYSFSRLSAQEKARGAGANLNYAASALLGLYLLNLVDVFVFHPSSGTIAIGPKMDDGYVTGTENRMFAGVQASWRWQF